MIDVADCAEESHVLLCQQRHSAGRHVLRTITTSIDQRPDGGGMDESERYVRIITAIYMYQLDDH